MEHIVVNLETNTLDENYNGEEHSNFIEKHSDLGVMQKGSGRRNRCLLFKNNGDVIGKLILF